MADRVEQAGSGSPDPAGRLPGVFGLRNGLANMHGVERDEVRVLSGNVGGSFGMKAAVYPEYLALFHAARTLGRL